MSFKCTIPTKIIPVLFFSTTQTTIGLAIGTLLPKDKSHVRLIIILLSNVSMHCVMYTYI